MHFFNFFNRNGMNNYGGSGGMVVAGSISLQLGYYDREMGILNKEMQLCSTVTQ